MLRPFLTLLALMLTLASPASAFQQCQFSFEIDTQSSAFQARIRDAQETGGLWRPIREAPDDVRAISHFIGRLDICLVTPDGKPRTFSVNGHTTTLQSPHVTSCTAALLPGNRLLTNRHCFYEPTLANAGFNIVQEARVNFDYVSKDFTDDVKTFLVLNREVALDEKLDAMVLQIIGGDANESLGGNIPLLMETRATPRRKMTMVHHPRGAPQQFSDYTCQIHPDQALLPDTASQLRHRCESAGGSSGSLLLDARSLAVVGLHNQGGMGPAGGFNGGHKIEMINAALNLGFTAVTAPEPVAKVEVDPTAQANAALVAALLEQDQTKRRAALEQVVQEFSGTQVAISAQNALASLTLPAPKPAPVTAPNPMPEVVQVLRVRPDGTGDHRTISAAIKAAKPNAVIEIYPGTYTKGLTVNKPLELVGIGDRSEIVLEAEDADVIYWKARGGRISNLTLRQLGGNFYAAYFLNALGTIEDSDLTSQGSAVITVQKDSDIMIKDNLIHDSVSAGIYVIEGAHALVDGNEISGNKLAGIEVKSDATAVIRNNELHSGIQTGLLINSTAEVVIENNDIHDNELSGVEIKLGGQPVVRGNRIINNRQTGVHVTTKATGLIESNQISGNAICGIVIEDEANPEVRDNIVHDNSYHAIWVLNKASAKIYGNDLRRNERSSFLIADTAGTVTRTNNKTD